jgi:DNA mismatch repair ATPase MutS
MVMHTAKKDRIRLPFEVDKQTWKDIDLFDQGGPGPVFTLFCRVKTAGGAEALERMLKTPSNQRSLLEGRQETIRFFRDAGVDLCIGKEQLKKIEQYLSSVFPRFPGSWSGVQLFSLRHQLQKEPAYFTLIQGIRTTVSLLRHLFQLRDEWLSKGCPPMLSKELEGLPDLLTERRVSELVLGDSRHLTAMDLARCDCYFRGAGKVFLRRLLQLLYEWDVFEAVAKVAQQHELCFPQYDDQEAPGPAVEASGLFPLLRAGAVSNDFELGGEANLCFVSGAGMAGKTTFLKSFAMAVYLAHVGFPVPARSFRTTILNGLVTTIDLADCVGQGFSRCYAEVSRIKQTLRQIKEKKRVLVIFDELFRGIPVKDASRASIQVIAALAGIGHSLFLVSSPIVETTDGLKGNPSVRFVCFESTMEGGVPWYGYKLKNGVSHESVEMLMLENEGLSEMLAEIQDRKIEYIHTCCTIFGGSPTGNGASAKGIPS